MKALILVDLQNDFLPGGSLAVPKGDEVIPVANRLQSRFPVVVATQDWHPKNHKSFASNHPGKKPGDVIDLDGTPQVLWPEHCVQGSEGSEFAPNLNTKRVEAVFQKGTDPQFDSYSGFFDNGHRRATRLADYLKARKVDEVYVMGLATDYCVRFTALDAVKLGFKTTLIEDGCRGVELNEGDSARAIDEMTKAGVALVKSAGL
jgi:nicotinamidase/pyrazinamidase